MLIDSHCHFDEKVFDADRDQIIDQAKQQGIGLIVIPATDESSFSRVQMLSQQYDNCCYTLGYHPMMIDSLDEIAINKLKAQIEQSADDPKFMGIGEIGLDLFVREDNLDKQVYFFTEQLKLANQFQLPVILHVRKAIDLIIKYCRQYQPVSGIAHAFNGSQQQAQQLIALGFKLGFGGAMTYTRARRIRALAQDLDLQHIVLETDAPDMPPAWLKQGEPNSPLSLSRIAEEMSALKQVTKAEITQVTSKNCCQVLPKLVDLCTSLQVLH